MRKNKLADSWGKCATCRNCIVQYNCITSTRSIVCTYKLKEKMLEPPLSLIKQKILHVAGTDRITAKKYFVNNLPLQKTRKKFAFSNLKNI